jgi:Amt family ammonium transporter
VNPAGGDGLFFGNPGQFVIQLIAVGVTLVFSFAVSYILFKILDATMGLRVTAEDEVAGLDITEHQETAYNL